MMKINYVCRLHRAAVVSHFGRRPQNAAPGLAAMCCSRSDRVLSESLNIVHQLLAVSSSVVDTRCPSVVLQVADHCRSLAFLIMSVTIVHMPQLRVFFENVFCHAYFRSQSIYIIQFLHAGRIPLTPPRARH